MKKTLCAILLLALLCTLVGCGQDNYGYPLWLPTEGNYLKRGTRSFVCTVSNGEIVESEIAFTEGNEHLRAVWRTGDEKVRVEKSTQLLSVSVPLRSLPDLVEWTDVWVQETDYQIRLHPLDETTDIPLSDGLALMDCGEGRVEALTEPYTNDDVMGALVITTPERDEVLWKIYLVPAC